MKNSYFLTSYTGGNLGIVGLDQQVKMHIDAFYSSEFLKSYFNTK
jgi:hypothetical protein